MIQTPVDSLEQSGRGHPVGNISHRAIYRGEGSLEQIELLPAFGALLQVPLDRCSHILGQFFIQVFHE